MNNINFDKKEKNQGFFCPSFFSKTRKAQVGDTMTWVIVTIIIIFVLLVFIFAASNLGKAKDIQFKILYEPITEDNFVDWMQVKSSYAYELNDNNKGIIGGWIKNVAQ